jgi:hypothetical protein
MPAGHIAWRAFVFLRERPLGIAHTGFGAAPLVLCLKSADMSPPAHPAAPRGCTHLCFPKIHLVHSGETSPHRRSYSHPRKR